MSQPDVLLLLFGINSAILQGNGKRIYLSQVLQGPCPALLGEGAEKAEKMLQLLVGG